MRNRNTVFALTILLASTSIANAVVLGGTHNSANANASAHATAVAGAIAAQKQSQRTSVSTSQSQRTRQFNEQANQQTYNNNEPRPSGIAPSIGLGGFASGPCVGVTTQGGFGVGLPGGAAFGGSAGRSELDDECTRRETARILHLMGQQELAIKVMLASPVVQSVMQSVPVTAPVTTRTATATSTDPRCSSRWISDLGRKDLGC